MNLLVGLKQGCILNLVEFGCVGAEKKWGSVLVVWFIRKIRPTQLWVELSWVVAINDSPDPPAIATHSPACSRAVGSSKVWPASHMTQQQPCQGHGSHYDDE